MSGPVTVTLALSKPIDAHGEKISTLTLREPFGRDIARCGIPLANGRVDTVSLHAYISTLAGIPTSSVDQLCPADFFAAGKQVTDFLGLTQPKS